MTTATATRTYTCALCAKQSSPEAMIYSAHTGHRYCRDLEACDRRRKRRGRVA